MQEKQSLIRIPFLDVVEAGNSSVNERCVNNSRSAIFLYSNEKTLPNRYVRRYDGHCWHLIRHVLN